MRTLVNYSISLVVFVGMILLLYHIVIGIQADSYMKGYDDARRECYYKHIGK